MSAIKELELKLNENQEIEFNFNDFLLAVKCGNTQYVEKTLQNKHINVGLYDDKNKTALNYALEAGYITIAKLLINSNKMGLDSIFCRETYLIQSLKIGAIDLIELLIKKGANVNLKGKNGSSSLLIALENEYFDIAKLLLKNNADINIRNNDGWTPLIWASTKGYKNIVKFLLDNGANINIKNNDGWSAIVGAYFKGFTDIVALLSDKKAIFSSNYAERTMILAYENGNIDVVKELVKQGINVNIKAKNNKFLLLLALENEDKTTIKLLLDNGANINNIPEDNILLKKFLDKHNSNAKVKKENSNHNIQINNRPSLLYRAYAKSY